MLAVGAVILGPFIASFQSRLLGIGLPDIKGAMGLGFDEGAWLSAAAAAPQILIAPAVAWLATVFGVRRLFVGPALAYAYISLLIPLVHDYRLQLALHVLHGLLLGVFVPATMMVILRNLPTKWWIPAMAVYAFRLSFTSNAGVSLLAFYVQTAGWQWVYWQDVAVAPLMALLAYFGAPKEPINREVLLRADWGGMLLFGAGLMCLFLGLDHGNRLDWTSSGTVIALLAGAGVLLISFLVHEAIVADPWASAGVILSRNTGLMLLTALMFLLTSVSNTSLLPNFLIAIRQLRPEQMGPLLLDYVALPLFVVTPLTVLLLRRVDARLVLTVGMAALGIASYLGTRLTADWSLDDFIPMALLQSLGLGATFLAIIVYAFANADFRRATSFSAYIQVLRLVGPEVGAALMTTVLRQREQTYSYLLGLHVASGDQRVAQTVGRLTGAYMSHGPASANARSLSSLSSMVSRQANVLAYIDGFWLTFAAAVIGLCAVIFMTAAPPGPLTPRGGAP
ncbi:MFS transporter [Bradyrhizobium sp. USDA 4369]